MTIQDSPINHRPSVFTEFNNRERFASMNNGRTSPGITPPALDPSSATTTQLQQTDALDGEWFLVGKNGKITPANRHKKEVLPTTIGTPCPEPSIPIMEDSSSHWQIEISFVPTSSQIVSVPKTMTAMLNHLQAVDPCTVIAPVHYKDATEDEYLVTTADIPVTETKLDTYLVKYDNTRSGRIGLTIIIASNTTFNSFKQDRSLIQWFKDEKLSVLLDMIDAAVPRPAGFFIRLLPKAESLDLHYARMCTYLPEAPTFQLVPRILKTKHPASGKDRYTNVVQAITDSDDCDELVVQLRLMCDNVAGYEFYPLEEFHCLEHSAKLMLINRQIEFAKTYSSIVASGFENEYPEFRMWMPPPVLAPTSPPTEPNADTNHHSNPATPVTGPNKENNGTTPLNTTTTIPEPMVFCDDVVMHQTPPIITTKEAFTAIANQALEETGHDSEIIDVDSDIVTDISKSNKRLRTINGSVPISGTSRALATSSNKNNMELISITQFLYTIQSGDGTPLFAFVYEPIGGKRELVTSKYQEATRFVTSLHPYLVRRMNPTARDILYPNQQEAITSALDQPDWKPFRIFSEVAPLQGDFRGPPSNSASTTAAFTRTATSRGRGGGRNTFQTSTTQQHWYYSNRTASQHHLLQEPSTSTFASVTTVKTNETYRYTPSKQTSTQFPKTTKRLPSPNMQLTATIMTASVTPSQPSQTANSSAMVISGLQTQLENMTMRQQELENRVQSQIQGSLRELEARQAEYSKANNEAIQAEMSRNKTEASQEMSATMQFLRMLNDNATTAKTQSETFQATLLQRLDAMDSSHPSSTMNPSKATSLTIAHATNASSKSIMPQATSTTISRSTTPASLPLTTLRATNIKRQQQQSILATMSKIGQQPPLGGTDNEMSRHRTDHGLDGKNHRPDTVTHDPTHHT